MKKILYTLIIIHCSLLIIEAQVQQEWVRRYPDTSTSTAEAEAMALDDSGNVYITGLAIVNSQYHYCTIKYNTIGVQQWVTMHTGGIATSIAVDRSSNVYITGYINNDYCTIKYSSNGVQQWVNYYNDPYSGEDEAEKIAVDNAGNVYVSGYTNVLNGGWGYSTVKYSSDGRQLWVQSYGGVFAYVNSLLVDDSCYVYLTGENQQRATTIKYDSSGNQIWVQQYNGLGIGNTGANSLAIDSYKNVYITGFSPGLQTYWDYFTIKYSYSGVQQWVRRFNTDSMISTSANDGKSIVLDNTRNIYIAGFAGFTTGQQPTNFCTLKYSNSGEILWVKRDSAVVWGGPISMVNDNNDNIYIAGSTSKLPLYASYTTIKYDSSGTQKWRQTYNNQNGDSWPYSLLVDKAYNIFLTGSSSASMCTIKYSQPVGIIHNNKQIPGHFVLHQNYPNPFNPVTKIKLEIPLSKGGLRGLSVKLIIYDVLGHEVTTLVNEQLKPGSYEVLWDGSNYTSGVYFYRIFTDQYSETKKMILLK
jgi:hypothetical protein